ncbi:MAG: hypothetical protein ABIU06_14590 [Anaerolineales bacterium]
METQNITPNEPSEDKTVSASAKSKFGIFGLIIGIPGFAISVSTAFLIYFIAMAGGGLDIMLTDTQPATIVSTLYFGFFGILGGILGAVSLSRGGKQGSRHYFHFVWLANTLHFQCGYVLQCTFLIMTFSSGEYNRL